MVKILKSIFDFRHPKKQLIHIILLSFLISFSAARMYSVFIVKGQLYIHGFHIHHFYFGMLALSIGGIVGLLGSGERLARFASILMGIGIGLFTDEIGLLLNCTTTNRECTYAFPDTFDIIGFISIAILAVVVLVDISEKYLKTSNPQIGK